MPRRNRTIEIDKKIEIDRERERERERGRDRQTRHKPSTKETFSKRQTHATTSNTTMQRGPINSVTNKKKSKKQRGLHIW
jgi:hypothetical protein